MLPVFLVVGSDFYVFVTSSTLKFIRVLNQLFTIQRVVCLVVMGYRKLLKVEKEKGRHNSRHKTSSDIYIHGDQLAVLIP
jgi:hypothetical protein